MRRAFAILLLVGCGDDRPAAPDARVIDSTPIDAPDPRCFGSGTFAFCVTTEPTAPRTLAGMIDTTACSDGEVLSVGAASACVIAGSSIEVSALAYAQGDKPLVVASMQNMTITALLDVATRTIAGAGGNPTQCATTVDGAAGANAGAGGAGGSFGSTGGNGGAGYSGETPTTTAAAPVGAPSSLLRGGCRGGAGGRVNGTLGAGGGGGGALMLVARGTIALAAGAVLNASGSGGNGGAAPSGGGGAGGSGGMIVLHASNLVVDPTARVIANGGGAGGGANSSDNGNAGTYPDPSKPLIPAPGADTFLNNRSRGGQGAAGTGAAGSGDQGVLGGGGGGGGLGQIRVLRPTSFSFPAGSISPTPTN